MYKVKSEAGWGLEVFIENVTFKNFKEKQTACGMT